MFDDEDWLVKILLGGVFTLLSGILIGIPFVLGYMLEVIRRVARRDPELLPDWDNLGEKFVQGLVLMVILAIWLIPLWILGCFQSAMIIPLAENQDAAGWVAMLVSCTGCLSILWSVLVALFTPAIYTRYAVTGQFSSAFQFGEIWNFTTKNFVNVLIALLLAWVAGLIGSFGVILCVIGVVFTGFWATLVGAHLYGQVYRLAGEEEPTAVEAA